MKFIRKFLFHRATLVSLAIIAQLLIIVGVVWKFHDYFGFYYGASVVVGLVAVVWILNQNINPVYKLAWVIPILLFPVLGGLFYLFFGGNKLSKRTRRRMMYISDKSQEAMKSRQKVLEEITSLSQQAGVQSRYIERYSFYPAYTDTYTEYLSTGEIKFEKLKEELKKAESFIFLEYFIIEEGKMWNSILEILKEKVKQGLDVRLIYDDFGCLMKLPYKYYQRLEEMGIQCAVFNPLIPIPYARLNNRNHRKIAVIDGHTGITGGINLADEYINAIEKHGHWKDTAILVKGPAVWNMTVMFLSMWDYIKGIDEDFSMFRGETPLQIPSDRCGFVQPFADGPLDDEPVGETVYLNLINKAREYVYITTPYLIIDNEMVMALTSAAKGGVDIRIITPYLADKTTVHEVTKSYYRILIESGVKIYEYTPGFIHSKTFVSDDDYGVVGTINMDFRSLYLHFECAVWMYRTPSIADIKEDFLDTLKVCKQVTIQEVRGIQWFRALAGSILRVFAPMM